MDSLTSSTDALINELRAENQKLLGEVQLEYQITHELIKDVLRSLLGT